MYYVLAFSFVYAFMEQGGKMEHAECFLKSRTDK